MGSFIEYLNDCPYNDQLQLPNPTVIDSPQVKGKEHTVGAKTIVFTAYLQEEYHSKEAMEMDAGSENPATESWYPTIFFYDLKE